MICPWPNISSWRFHSQWNPIVPASSVLGNNLWPVVPIVDDVEAQKNDINPLRMKVPCWVLGACLLLLFKALMAGLGAYCTDVETKAPEAQRSLLVPLPACRNWTPGQQPFLTPHSSSLQSCKRASVANLSWFVTCNSPGRGGNYHIWGQFT